MQENNQRKEDAKDDSQAPKVDDKLKPLQLDIKHTLYPIGVFNKDDADKSFYIERKQQISKLVNILTMSPGHSSTLVTGHRGTGKTSFVYECINQTKSLNILRFMQEPTSIRWINIFLFIIITFLLTNILTTLVNDVIALKAKLLGFFTPLVEAVITIVKVEPTPRSNADILEELTTFFLLPVAVLLIYGLIWITNRKVPVFSLYEAKNTQANNLWCKVKKYFTLTFTLILTFTLTVVITVAYSHQC